MPDRLKLDNPLPAGGLRDVNGMVPLLRAAAGRTRGDRVLMMTLGRLLSDLAPFLTRIDVIPDQTEDPVLSAAAKQVYHALRALLTEIAVVIYKKR